MDSYNLSEDQIDNHCYQFVEANGKLHALAYVLGSASNSWANFHYVLENGAWVSKDYLGTAESGGIIYGECGVCVYDDKVHVGNGYSSQYYDTYWVYDEDNNEWTSNSYNYNSTAKQRDQFLVTHNNTLYSLQHTGQYATLLKGKTLTTVGSISVRKSDVSSYITIRSNVVSFEGYLWVIIECEKESRCLIIDTSAKNVEIVMPTYNINQLRVVNGNLYGTDKKGNWYKLNRGQLTFEPHIVKTHTMFEYNSNLYCFDKSTKAFQKVDKLYKKATSYATRYTKILANNSFAISDNLEVIDNGFLVTESGEIKIGIYE
jgi:hypothetical protein